MKRFFIINVALFAMISLLTACGGEEGGGSSDSSRTADTGGVSPSTTLSGTVADGYLTGAQVFLDRNGNRIHDNGEPLTVSTAGGVYTLDVNPGEGELYSVVVRVIAGQTIDEDTGLPVTHSYVLESLPGAWEFISPLTTLVRLERDKNPSYSDLQSEIEIRSKLGIADTVSLFSDYLADDSVDAALADEFGRAHRVAQIVARLMGTLRSRITQNIGGQITDSEQPLVAYLISDQILWQAQLIEYALAAERNQGLVLDVNVVTDAVSAEINLSYLDSDLLSLYGQRVVQNLETWDMQAPQIQSSYPPAGDSSSVDVRVTVAFDELLDETLLNDGIVALSGPNGLVSGRLDYAVDEKRLTFTPDQLLLPFSNYQVSVSALLADTLGNSLVDDVTWTFTTIFDQAPPALPDF